MLKASLDNLQTPVDQAFALRHCMDHPLTCWMAVTGTPCSLKDAACLTDRKPTNNEEYGTTLILSVDDEPVNHMVIEECISSTGYKVSP